MDVLDVTRLQFAVVTIYHYFFVPLSISLAAVAAGLQVAWMRTGDARWRDLTVFVGRLLMVTFAVGVVTGLVQEFQFGMAWSAFARFYGDVFGPTLAVEGMLAFFLEATFLALWHFGWDRLPRPLHLACIGLVAAGTVLSAFIILAANSFMQNPVGYALDPATGRARLTSFTDLMLNKVNLAAFPHTLSGAVMVGGALLLALGVWRRHADPEFGTLARLGAWLTAAGGALTAVTGDHLGKVITQVQPMKMAAAEALYATTTGAPFSLFAVGAPGSDRPSISIEVPKLLSILAKGSPDATVSGIDDLQAQYVQQFGPGSYVPMVPVAFWSFRAMIGVGMLAMAAALGYLWLTRGGRVPHRMLRRALPLIPLLPAAANTLGWIFTETARQPWLAFGLFTVGEGISPGLTRGEAITSLLGFTLVYAVLAVLWLRVVRHLARQPLRAAGDAEPSATAEPAPVY
ncbi:cytochrome ubiquinol oxidase subunit I [Mangrovihabitans endophyticus]|uniref:Cytochrome ubiquinol oxidase subunit I n=1 Tax=Mangrovihabitans endophyticus TaxID=1751298 RepID=A0A8J3FS53_9ACTN|nr:cytochrome ubiquinol oxidase subunit I [Mangrovihabitans endophyticus]GGL17084.1 cytochrome ubiquinol oxidase subunit I [Mangrovihabitans endophyticus]